MDGWTGGSFGLHRTATVAAACWLSKSAEYQRDSSLSNKSPLSIADTNIGLRNNIQDSKPGPQF